MHPSALWAVVGRKSTFSSWDAVHFMEVMAFECLVKEKGFQQIKKA
jgi:hypothetical protein